MSKKLDIELEEIKAHVGTVKILAEVDKAGASIRPYIALMMAWVLAFTIVVMVLILAYAIGKDLTEMIGELTTAWLLVLTVLGPPIALLNSYFGKRNKEETSRYNMAVGQASPISMLGGLAKAFRGFFLW